MKIKAIVTALFLSLNLSGNEILTPQEAKIIFDEDFGQLNDFSTSRIRDYGSSEIKPSFKCSNKFKKYSLDDFICNSNFNAFRDNYFASLYSIIIKENPKLKDKALKIARERIKETKKECLIYTKKQYDYSFIEKGAFFVSESIYCINTFYRDYSSRLALMLYDNDKKLFKKIFGNDYEKFKEALSDSIKSIYPGLEDEQKNKIYKESYNKFIQKYYQYHYDDTFPQIDDLIYILSIQYNLIDSTGKFK